MLSKTFAIGQEINLPPLAGQELFWSSKELTLTGIGEAARVTTQPLSITKVENQPLEGIVSENHMGRKLLPGEGPCAFAAFPFNPAKETEIVIPRILLGEHSTGQRWVTYIGDNDQPADEIMEEILSTNRNPHFVSPTEIQVTSPIEPEIWRDEKVTSVTNLINRSEVEKVVLARELILTANTEIPVNPILAKLRETHGNAMIFNIDGFIGASPELLVSRFENSVRANPLAGTVTRYSDKAVDDESKQKLLDSTKDAYEHKVTIEWLLRELLSFCSFVDADPEPKIVSLPHVHHLGTEVNGHLSQPPASILELVAALHPTPAVAGDPQPNALEIIRSIEGIDRQRYAGPVGWFDASGNGEFAVGIRSAEIIGNSAHLFAGVGLVADSEPQSELDETRSKFQTMLSTIINL